MVRLEYKFSVVHTVEKEMVKLLLLYQQQKFGGTMTNRDRNYEKMWERLKKLSLEGDTFPYCRGWVLAEMERIENGVDEIERD